MMVGTCKRIAGFRSFFLGAGLMLVLAASGRGVLAQADEVFNQYLIQPEVHSMPGTPEAGVDAQGDLNLSVPVMTIPGRGGLDYPITLTYSSAIKATQEAGWLGLGWHFDPGSITRDPQAGPPSETTVHGVDFTESRAKYQDAYYASLPGIGTYEFVRGVFNNGSGGLPDYPKENDTGGIDIDWTWDRDFKMTSWRPWVIQAKGGSVVSIPTGHGDGSVLTTRRFHQKTGGMEETAMEDYERFAITTEEGTRYLFDVPSISTYISMSPLWPKKNFEHYVSTWRLRAILGADFFGDDVPEDGDAGSWIRLDYRSVHTLAQPVSDRGTPGGSDQFTYRQAYYLERIVTPTHEATFEVTGESSGFDTVPEERSFSDFTTASLSRITLAKRTEGSAVVLREVEFVRDAENPFGVIWNGEGESQAGELRAKLTGIVFKDRYGDVEPGYVFEYDSPNPTSSYTGSTDGLGLRDDFGFFAGHSSAEHSSAPFSVPYCIPANCSGTQCLAQRCTDMAEDDKAFAASAWSLTGITYPTGLKDEFDYEPDYVNAEHMTSHGGSHRYGIYTVDGQNNSDAYAVANRGMYQGGTRVKRIVRTEPVGETVVERRYSYGGGVITGIPDGFWGDMPGSIWGESGRTNYAYVTSSSRNKARVLYEHVKEESYERVGGEARRVGLTSLTAYTTPITHPDMEPYRTIIHKVQDVGPWSTERGVVVINGNLPNYWGKPWKTERAELDPEEYTLQRVVTTERLERGNYQALSTMMTLEAGGGVPGGYPFEPATVSWAYDEALTSELREEVIYVPDEPPHRIRTQVVYERDFGRESGAEFPLEADGLGLLRRVIEMPFNHVRPVVKEVVYAGDMYPELRRRGILTPTVAEYTYEIGNDEEEVGEDPFSDMTRGFFALERDSLHAYADTTGMGDLWAGTPDGFGSMTTGYSGGGPIICDYRVMSSVGGSLTEPLEDGCYYGDDEGGDDDEGGGGGDPDPVEHRLYHAANVTAWRAFSPDGGSFWKPARKYQWNASEGADQRPVFSGGDWVDPPRSPDSPASGEWDLVETYEEYDHHGQLTRVSTPRESVNRYGAVDLVYGGLLDTELREVAIETDESADCDADVKCLRQTMEYDSATGLPISATDPNGQATRFSYDSGLRLAQTVSPAGLVTTANSYNLGGSSQNSAPRFVEAATYSQGNLLKNGSFEIETGNGGSVVPEDWDTTSGASLSESANAPMGSVMARLTGGEVSQHVAVEGGREYMLVVSFNGSEGSARLYHEDGGHHLQVLSTSTDLSHAELGDGTHELYEGLPTGFLPGVRQQWVRFRVGSTGTVRVGFQRASGATGDSFVDAVVLSPLPTEADHLSDEEALAGVLPSLSVAFVDGNGRVIQTVESEGPYHASTKRVHHIERDWAGRPIREYLPFEREGDANAFEVFDEAAGTSAASYYTQLFGGDDGGAPYVEKTYWAGGGSARTTRPPGLPEGEGVVTNTPSVYRHRFQDGHLLTVRRNETVDLGGNRSFTFVDERGNHFLTRRYAAVEMDGTVAPQQVIGTEAGQTATWDYTPGRNLMARLTVKASLGDPDPASGGGIKSVAGVHIREDGRGVEARSLKAQGVLEKLYDVRQYDPRCSEPFEEGGELLWPLAGPADHTEFCFPYQEESFTADVPLYEGRHYEFEAKAWQTQVLGNPVSEATITIDFEQDGKVFVFSDTEMRYDVLGNLIETRPPNYGMPPEGSVSGDWVSTFDYDTRSRVEEERTPDAGTVRYKYALDGSLRYSQDANQAQDGAVAFRRYDGLGRVVEAGVGHPACPFDDLDPAIATTCTDAVEGGTSHWEWLGENRREAYVYDDPAKMRTFEPIIPIVQGWPFFGQTWFDYGNAKGQLIASAYKSDGKWQATHYGYDENGRLARKWVRTEGGAPEWEEFHYEYDAVGNLVRRTVEVGEETLIEAFTYDGRGNLHRVYATNTALTASTRAEAEYEYTVSDAVAEVRLHEKPDGSFATEVPYEYDIKGRLTNIGDVEASGEAFAGRYDYDPAGKVASMEFRTPHSVQNCAFDPEPCAERWRYDLVYDGLGRLDEARYVYHGAPNHWNSMAYDVGGITYDANGNLASMIRYAPTDNEPWGQWVDELVYIYEAGTNRIEEVTDNTNGWWVNGNDGDDFRPALEWDAKPTDFEYDANGNIVGMEQTWHDGSLKTTAFAAYDERNLPLRVTLPGNIMARYRYNAAGQRVWTHTHSLGGVLCDPDEPCNDPNFSVRRFVRDGSQLVGTFDGEGTLLSWNLHTPGASAPLGRLEVIEVEIILLREAAEQRAVDTLSTETERLLYEAMLNEGGLSKAMAQAVAAEALQVARDTMLQAVPGAVAAADDGSAFLDADAAGSNFYKEVLSGIEQALYTALIAEGYSASDAEKIAETAAPDAASRASNLVQGAVEESRAPAEPTTVARRYYVADHLGSVRAVVDAGGNVREARDYYPFGLQMPGRVYVQGSETREGYTGHELDAETGMYYAGARYYMPALGRWTSTDPLEEYPSPYVYVGNNPISLIDPTGMSSDSWLKDEQEKLNSRIGIGSPPDRYVFGSSGDLKRVEEAPGAHTAVVEGDDGQIDLLPSAVIDIDDGKHQAWSESTLNAYRKNGPKVAFGAEGVIDYAILRNPLTPASRALSGSRNPNGPTNMVPLLSSHGHDLPRTAAGPRAGVVLNFESAGLSPANGGILPGTFALTSGGGSSLRAHVVVGGNSVTEGSWYYANRANVIANRNNHQYSRLYESLWDLSLGQ